jgi:hypothetical protein
MIETVHVPLRVLTKFTFDADCSVTGALSPQHSPSTAALDVAAAAAARAFREGARIVRIGSVHISSRGELRDYFERHDMDADSDVEVVVASRQSVAVPLDGSVECDGVVCDLAGASATIHAENDSPTPSQPVRPQPPVVPKVEEGEEGLGGFGGAFGRSGAACESLDVIPLVYHPPTAFGGADADLAGTADVLVPQVNPLERAVLNATRGRGVIIVLEGSTNPLTDIERLSRKVGNGAEIITADFGNKLRLRVTDMRLTEMLRDAMTHGKWFVAQRATKSLSLLEQMSAIIKECWDNDLKGVHEQARFFICTEPHPHFPQFLASKCAAVKIKHAAASASAAAVSSLGALSMLSFESIHGLSMALRGGLRDPSASVLLPQMITAGVGTPAGARRRVKLSTAVNIVDIETRDVFRVDGPELEAGPLGATRGALSLSTSFAGLRQDKFFGIAKIPGADASNPTGAHYAVSSSAGNIYVLDARGTSSMSFHGHDASVWGLNFVSPSELVTGAEDASVVAWSLDAEAREVSECARFKCSNDVYSVQWSKRGDVLAAGGLMTSLCLIRAGAAGAVQNVPTGTSVQVVVPWGDSQFVTGGGDGSIAVVDAGAGRVVHTLQGIHAHKVPAMAVVSSPSPAIVSGSFDMSARLWDPRQAPNVTPISTLKFKQHVTGLASDGNYMSASVGENLYLWDLRTLRSVVGGCSKAWSGLSRAMCMDADTKSIVTASPDGLVRYWAYQ